MTCTRYELPDELASKILSFMSEAGLEMGSIDMIRSAEDGEYYFLEVNEQGQFLWVEEKNPEIQVLDACARFLVGQSPATDHNDVLRYSDFLRSERWVHFAEHEVVPPPDYFSVQEP